MSQTKELITSFRFRQDTLANWNLANPILKDGEFILIKDTAEYKVGNGVSKFSELPVRGIPAVQDKGQSILNVMSQKAVTDELNRLDGVDTAQTSEINSVKSGKVDKSSILSTFPTVEPTDHTTLVSAKEAYKKVKELSDKNTQIEQDVNVLRGDVQGVSFFSNTNNLYTADIESFRNTTLHLVLSNLNAITSPEVIVSNTGSSTGYRLSCTGTGSIQFFYCMSAFTFPASRVNTIDIVIDNNLNALLYNNGVFVGTKIFDVSKWSAQVFTLGALITQGQEALKIGKINSIRKLNTALTQQQIDYLYNQGRCDEVVLGDEWREVKLGVQNTAYLQLLSVTLSNRVFTFNSGSGSIGEWLKSEYINMSDNRIIEVTFDYTSPADVDIRLNSIALGHYANPLHSCRLNSGSGSGRLVGHIDKYLHMYIQQDATGVVLSNISFRQVALLNEYLPQYLTSAKWIDNGVNKQDIPLTAPTFTYIRPYKQHLFGSGAPTIPPDAAFTEYSDTATGNIWKCGTKPNTRQFAVSDWKQINN